MPGRATVLLAGVPLLAIGACSSRSPAPPGGGPAADVEAGLDARPQNASCIAPERAASAADIRLAPVFQDLVFDQPLAMLQAPGDDSRWFVLEKPGRVRAFANDPAVSSFDADLIDLGAAFLVNDSSEGGLLGMAFAADFAASGTVYLSWTEGSPMVSRIDRFRSLDGGKTLDPGSRETVISLDQPFGNHDGGQIAIGPDGYLYAGFGDGGSGGDPDGHAQNTRDLLGAMLRIDVDASPYAIPPGNPFAGNARCPADHTSATDCPEIYAWGLRNPWRWSFDRGSGALWAGDVGQSAFEEIDRIELGLNYGWDCREGFTAFSGAAPSCQTAAQLTDPVHAYDRTQGTSVTGGYVYRGSAVPSLVGSYVFGDYGSGRIWRLVADGSGGYLAEELLDTDLAIASFAEDVDGELYVVDIAGGGLYRIDDAGGGAAAAAPPVPDRLSATGCFGPVDPSEPAAGLIPYRVAAPFWSDGADKERWIAVPDGAVVAVGGDGDFAFPPGTVLAKHFRLGGALVETRLLVRHPDGAWAGYSYEWDDAQTDARLVVGGKTVTVGGQSWIFPSSDQCRRCHTAAAGFSLGLEAAQLNTELTYAATGRTANQLATLDAIGLFASPLGDPSDRTALPDPFDGAASLDARARAYLHTNCAQCHRPGGPTSVEIDLRFSTPLGLTGTCGMPPQRGDLGIAGAEIIAPGRPDESVLLERLGRRGDPAAMPPLASSIADPEGVSLVRSWILGLASC